MRRRLLRVVKENKNICDLTDYDNWTSTDAEDDSIMFDELDEIEYYLKLNRFGRRLLDSPNLQTGLWPSLLAPMTTQPQDAGALFFLFARVLF
jgi:hypothetical protein